jgi:peptidoglycan hydrolase CwlO-like protein
MALINFTFYDQQSLKLLNEVLKKLNNMPTKQEFQAAFDQINEATNNIAADIDRLSSQIGSGMSEADQQDVLNQLSGISTKLRDIASKTPEQPTEPTNPDIPIEANPPA